MRDKRAGHAKTRQALLPARLYTEEVLLIHARTHSSIIVLVHGTIIRIGRKSRAWRVEWTQEQSLLRKSLQEALPQSYFDGSFSWSGGNSHEQRLEAGVQLARHLTKLADTFENLPMVIIAHSHGGNVALYAARVLPEAVKARIKGIVTLGTPFLWFRERWSDATKPYLVRGVELSATMWTIVSAASVFPLFVFARGLALIPLVMTGLIWMILWFLKQVQHLDWDTSTRNVISRFQVEVPAHVRILVATTNFDEAALWLRLFLVPAWMSDLLSFEGLRQFATIPGSPREMPRIRSQVYSDNLVASLIGNLLFNFVLEPILRSVSWFAHCLFAGVVGLAAIGFGFVGRLMSRSAPWGFGESWIVPWLVEIGTSLTPVGGKARSQHSEGGLTALNLNETGINMERHRFFPNALRSPHSWLHDDPRLINLIAGWSSKLLGEKSASSSSSPQ